MRIYKPKTKDGKDRKKFWVEVKDHRERRFRKVLRFAVSEEKDISQTIGDKIQKLIEFVAIGETNAELIDWLQKHTQIKLQDKLIKVGLLPVSTREYGRPLTEYLPMFCRAMFEQSKKSRCKKSSTSDTSSKVPTARVRKLFEGCGFNIWEDVEAEKINDFLEEQIKTSILSQQTAHGYVSAFRRFAGWMVSQGYIEKAPKINNVSTGQKFGRNFEMDEFEKLLEAAKNGSVSYGLTGSQRHLLYLLAMETGLRRGELNSLTVASVDLKNSSIFVKGEDTKNQNEAHQYFTPETGELLREYIQGKMPNVQLFNIHNLSAEMIRTDCEVAGIEVENHKGRLNFHSLRHSCGSFLAAQGVSPKELMEIMRHSNINLTLGRYTHILRGQKQKAINKLPRFANPEAKKDTAKSTV